MAQSLSRLISFEEYLALPDNDNRYEWVNGELICMAPPTGQHADIVEFLVDALRGEIKRLGLDWVVRPGNVGIRTVETKSRLPDVCVITGEQRQAIKTVAAVLRTPPPLVVEVVSESTKNVDYRAKRSEYAAVGIPEYWIVDPMENKVIVLTLMEGFYEEVVFTGTQTIQSQVFQELNLTCDSVLSV
ncbi:hypothetical protein NUACC21_46040 [Scytonema sp. NUACC21]